MLNNQDVDLLFTSISGIEWGCLAIVQPKT